MRLYLVCALLTTVSAGNMLKREKYQISWSVLYSSHITSHHHLSEAFKSVCAKWLQRFHSGANRIPHEAKRECVGEDKAGSAHAHLSARQPERTPLLPYAERCQAPPPCQ